MTGRLRAGRIGTVLAGGILLLGVMAGLPHPARAWFAASPETDSGSSRAIGKKKPDRLPGLWQVGAAGDAKGGTTTQPVRGFGHHVTLREALSGLLGPGWTILSRGVAPGTRIDWSGGTTLPRTLSRIARTYGLEIRVDWRSRTIALARPGVAEPVRRDTDPPGPEGEGRKRK